MKKQCRVCKEEKYIIEFKELTVRGYTYRLNSCKECEKNRYTKDERRDINLRTRYHVTKNEFDTKLETQDNACGLCKQPFKEGQKKYMDHCHETHVVRKVLCYNCNTGLGKFKHNPELLRQAANYIEEFL